MSDSVAEKPRTKNFSLTVEKCDLPEAASGQPAGSSTTCDLRDKIPALKAKYAKLPFE